MAYSGAEADHERIIRIAVRSFGGGGSSSLLALHLGKHLQIWLSTHLRINGLKQSYSLDASAVIGIHPKDENGND